MDELMFRAIMKEWYWLVIFASIVALAFTPSFLKAKCPRCGKRKLVSVEVESELREALETRGQRQFLTFYRCDGCLSRLFRERTGPFEDAAGAELLAAFDRAEQHDESLVP